ncbi:IBTK-like protein [Mya arenaria]|uniref:IBTK-like protein n=1 Tax=Mya arenaria TaxID=6604 RepID=A0ABY7EIM2_MYAAR|nr:IBTK-like protein [Mya arenaria]
MAAACGKVDVVEWLVEEMRGDITQKDAESGWTALHRAVFYGQLSAARLLIQYKSDITTRDHEGLGPLEIAMKDRELLKGVPSPVFTVSDGHEIFTWGDNSNFTLGHSTEQRRLTPEVVDVFRKMQKCLKQVPRLTDVPSVCGSVMRDCFEKLLEEADEFDLVHDLILQIKEQRWPVHRFIMISRCANFPSLLANIMISCDLEKPVLDLCDIQPQILEQLLRYIYTDTCDLVSPGAKFVLDRKSNDSSGELIDMDMEFGADVERIEGRRSAFEVISKQRQKKGKKKAQEQKGISSVSWKNGKVESTGKADLRTSLSFDRNKLRGTKWEMYDVSVVSDDGEVFQCHKCILVARLQYFHSMLGSGWIETSSNRPLPLAVPADVLDVLMEYLYTDDAKIIAVSMKNVGELLEFSSTYNAGELKATCQQFISLNLASLLEGRYLDVLSDEVIADLTQYYRQAFQ